MDNQVCFSVLALGAKYQELAKALATDLQHYCPGAIAVIGTDNPRFFAACRNVAAFQLTKQGILHCYHDKRFVMEKALASFPVVIQMDADTRLINRLPAQVEPFHGLAAVHIENLVEHVERYNPERLTALGKLAAKLEIDLNTVTYVGESLLSVSAAPHQSTEFIRLWGMIGRYLELHGIHGGSGNAIGLAAAKAGLGIIQPAWLDAINQSRQHLDASGLKSPKPMGSQFSRRFDYHYRFTKARIAALKEFNFYYR